MQATLLVITVISLALAAYFWRSVRRLQRLERERSDARVATLTAAANAHDSVGGWTQVAGEWQWMPEPQVSRAQPVTKETPQAPTAASSDRFFGTVERDEPSVNRLPLLAAAALIVILGGALVLFNTSESTDRSATVEKIARNEPLELVSLGHTRDAKVLTISGMVRNPSSGPKLEGLTAVVSLLDNAGALVSTKDVPLDYRALGPGEEAPFKVSIPDAGAIARYRVSFRAGTDVVPHVDRRGAIKLASALQPVR